MRKALFCSTAEYNHLRPGVTLKVPCLTIVANSLLPLLPIAECRPQYLIYGERNNGWWWTGTASFNAAREIHTTEQMHSAWWHRSEAMCYTMFQPRLHGNRCVRWGVCSCLFPTGLGLSHSLTPCHTMLEPALHAQVISPVVNPCINIHVPFPTSMDSPIGHGCLVHHTLATTRPGGIIVHVMAVPFFYDSWNIDPQPETLPCYNYRDSYGTASWVKSPILLWTYSFCSSIPSRNICQSPGTLNG